MCNKCKNGDTPRAVHFNGNFQNRRPDIPNDGTNLCIDRNGESTCLPSSWKVLLMEEIRLTSWGWFPLFTRFYTSQVVVWDFWTINRSIGSPLISWHSFRPLTLRSMPGMLGDSLPFTGLHTRWGSHIFVPLGVMHHDTCRWVRMILLVDEILHHFFCTLRLTLVLPLWMTQILHHLNDKRHPNIELRGQGDALTCPSFPSKSWCRILSTNRIVWFNVCMYVVCLMTFTMTIAGSVSVHKVEYILLELAITSKEST